MAVKTVMVTGSETGLKSVPLQALPREAWTSLVGGDSGAAGDIDTLYENIPWLYRGVNAICNALDGIEHVVHRGDKDGPEVDEDDLPFEVNLGELLDNWARMMTLRGAAYAFIERNRARTLKVRPLHPATMKPVYDKERGLIGFKRRLGSTEINLTLDDVAYVWQPNHKTEVGPGTSPARAALRAAGFLDSMDEYGTGYFKNGALNPTIIEMHEDTSDQDLERMESWYKRMLTGVKNAFSVKAAAGKVAAHTLGSSMKDLVVPELSNAKREDVATALGVPQTMMFSNAANYATAQQDDLHFYDKTVLPLDKKIVDALNKQIFIPMGLFLVAHTERMEIFQRQEMAKAYGMAQLFTVGAIPAEFLWDTMNMPDQYRGKGTFYRRPVNTASGGVGTQTIGKPDGQQPIDNIESPQNDLMKKWRVMALKRLKEGKPGKMADFESDGLNAVTAAAIRGALKDARTASRVNAVFDDAARWGSYP